MVNSPRQAKLMSREEAFKFTPQQYDIFDNNISQNGSLYSDHEIFNDGESDG